MLETLERRQVQSVASELPDFQVWWERVPEYIRHGEVQEGFMRLPTDVVRWKFVRGLLGAEMVMEGEKVVWPVRVGTDVERRERGPLFLDLRERIVVVCRKIE